MSKPTLTVLADFAKEFNQAIINLKGNRILVGIPASDEPRDEDDPITNAAILSINHFGSEDGKIPPRPVLSTGIRNAQEDIAEQMRIVAQVILKRGEADAAYERAGIIASNSCKKVINDQEGLAPPSEATLKARKYITASGFKGTKSLLVTGQTRNAITYVFDKKGSK